MMCLDIETRHGYIVLQARWKLLQTKHQYVCQHALGENLPEFQTFEFC